jgi:hypothetical protein
VLENKSSVKPYGDNPKDYGNMDYDTFLNSTEQTMENIFDITKPGGYNIWVVKDGRDTKNKRPYIDFHTGIAKAGMNAGFLYHDLIIWDQNDQRSLVLLGYPSKMYVNMNHNFIVVLHKPDEG